MFHAGKTDRGDPRKGPPSLLSHLSAQEGGDAGGIPEKVFPHSYPTLAHREGGGPTYPGGGASGSWVVTMRGDIFLSGKIPGGTFKKDRFVSLGRETFLSATQRDYALATLRPI